MRVHELAKKLGMESRKLIPELVRLGIEVTSHSNNLDDRAVQHAMASLQGPTASASPTGKQAVELDSAARQSRKKPIVAEPKPKEPKKSIRRALPPSPPAEQPKPEKKHVLFKRKKVEHEAPAEMVPVEGGLAQDSAVSRISELEPAAFSQIASTSETTSSPPSSMASIETPSITAPSGLSMPITVAPAEPSGQGRIEPSQDSVAPPLEAEQKPDSISSGKKESNRASVKEEEEARLRKTRKPGKPRDEELFAARYEDATRWQDLRPLPTLRREERVRHSQPTSVAEITKPRKKVVKLSQGITVKEFAELLGQRPAEVMKKLMDVGLPLTLNQLMNLDAGVLISEGFGVKAEVTAEKEGEALLDEAVEKVAEETLKARAPVVTIMGHVDHGKTSLLDAIRETKITEQEAGGITQHIGAYTVSVEGRQVTFLDTPGHEAFTAMRARGAKATDIVVLVVAADDGVMPQTVEAVHHAQAAQVPIVVAVNKIDKPGANPERVKQGLSEHGLIPEPWGGQTIFVEVSAKQKLGLDTLLEMILLQAEVLELKADVERAAKGVVLEAKLDRGRGPVATVLVQSGTLRVGDAFVVGAASGRVRALISDSGLKISAAGPSTPAGVVGLLGVPEAGDVFVGVKDERLAREIAESRTHKQRSAELAASGTRMTLDDLYSRVKEGEIKELPIVIKADTQGSVGALRESVQKFSMEQLSASPVNLRVIHSGVGGITETDVLLAKASGALVIGFHVRPDPKAAVLAEREEVEIRLYSVIYNVLSEIKAAAEGLLAPTLKERVLGRAEVRQVFNIPRAGTIAGCYVTSGLISRTSDGVRLIRDNVTVYEGKLGSLRRFKDDVREVQQGYECGIGVENYKDIKIDDVIEAYVMDTETTRL